MNIRKRRLQHPLDALLKQREWQRDLLVPEAARAQRVWEEREGAHREVLDVIADAESQLREIYRSPHGIVLERRRILELFLKHQHEVARERQQAAATAQALYRKLMVQLEASRIAVRVLEKHEERSRRAYDQRELRRELHVADEMWLLRRGPR
jgi:hypothetical protein